MRLRACAESLLRMKFLLCGTRCAPLPFRREQDHSQLSAAHCVADNAGTVGSLDDIASDFSLHSGFYRSALRRVYPLACGTAGEVRTGGGCGNLAEHAAERLLRRP